MTIAQNIRSARIAHGWTQHQLALAVEVMDRSVQRWESGGSTPDVAMLSAIARTLGTTLSALVAESPKKG